MRVVWPLLVVALGTACEQENERPPAADPCDPATMDCYSPPNSGGVVGGGEGGSDTGEDQATG
ncbi:MAG TPA: hypothetical protein VIW29_03290, partial [Polyangiaceae bacterium]